MDEEIVMTPSKHGTTTSIRIEKVKKSQVDQSMVAHTAGGQHRGLVINKQSAADSQVATPPQLQLEFKCFLIDHKTNKHVPESRILKFWFSPETEYFDRVTCAYEFFKELVRPENFPRDYVGFIKKVMKQMQQQQYTPMKKMEVDMRPLDAEEEKAKEVAEVKEAKPKEVVVQEQLLMTLESAYPNILPVDDLAQLLNTDEHTVKEQLKFLYDQNLIKEMEPGKWVRKVLDQKTEVKIVKQMPTVTEGRKPTIAIITSKYYEKLAVDSMMEDKTTFVRYKTEGESNVYTIGNIGPHRVVSTKLPQIGRQMAAQISSGNTTTRLLGTFGDVEHVLMVGVCGAVPHYTDYYNHVRLGDIIVSMPNKMGQLYIYCDKTQSDAQRSKIQFALKSWAAQDSLLRTLVESLYEKWQADEMFHPWQNYIEDGQELLQGQQVSFRRPTMESDRLFMNIGGEDVIEMQHPAVPTDVPAHHGPGKPMIRLGAIASGKPLVREDQLRLEFAARHQCIGTDAEFDQVLESIVGNRKESFMFIRGACDYLDGTKNAMWQPYSALVAAAFMKVVIEKMPVAASD